MGIHADVVTAIDANPDLSHHLLARKVAANVGKESLIQLATERIERLIVSIRRRRARALESDHSAAKDTGVQAESAKWATVDALLEEFRHQVIVDWTADLLASEFAVGDGSLVTWGRATANQHRARVALLARNARGNLEAIRRHEAALTTIAESGVACLDEVTR